MQRTLAASVRPNRHGAPTQVCRHPQQRVNHFRGTAPLVARLFPSQVVRIAELEKDQAGFQVIQHALEMFEGTLIRILGDRIRFDIRPRAFGGGRSTQVQLSHEWF
jgi:hypothetical protein